VSNLLVGALSVLLSTNPPVAVSNLVARTLTAPLQAFEDPRAAELREVMEFNENVESALDDLVSRYRNGDPSDPTRPSRIFVELQIGEQYAEVQRRYEAFIERHPDYVEGRLAFAHFLEENGSGEESLEQLKKAVEIDPRSAPAWNNLANYYGHYGEVRYAFPAYEKAVELRPFESLYLYNLATTVFLFRKDAAEYYQCDEQAVFERALGLYRKVRELRPDSFRYAFDFAQTYYGVKPAPATTPEGKAEAEKRLADQAMEAWMDALKIADNDLDREGVHVHLARWQIRLGLLDAARTNLALVHHENHQELKQRLLRNVAMKEDGKSAPVDDPSP